MLPRQESALQEFKTWKWRQTPLTTRGSGEASSSFLNAQEQGAVGVWRSDYCWGYKGVWERGHLSKLWVISKYSLVKLGEMQMNGFLVPAPPSPT